MKKGYYKFAWLTLTLLMIGSLILISCSSTTSNNTSTPATATSQPSSSETANLTPKYGGVLKIVPRNPAQSFGYGTDFTQPNGLECSYPCNESICDIDSSGRFIPGLATAYQVAPDGLSITFTLRQGVKFHDGSDFNAEAVRWNLEIMKKGRFVGTESWASSPALEVVDDYNVKLKLKYFSNDLIYQLASTSRIVSPTAFETNGDTWLHTHPVGTGPFKFVSFTPDVGITYERNDDYWGGKPYLDKIEYDFIKDDMAKAAALQSGAVDILFNVTAETSINLRDKGYFVSYSNPTLIGIVPDSANAESPLSNIKVREAVEYAIDRESLAKLGNGFWSAANQPCTPNTPGYISDFEGRKYDPEKAKQLLTEAGYANGANLKIIFSQSNVQTMDSMVTVQNYLSKVGINLDVQQVPADVRTTASKEGWKDGFVAFNLYTGLGYISGLTYNFGGMLFVSYSRPSDFFDLLKQATAAPDAASLEELSRKIINTLYDNAAVIPLWIAPQSLYAEQNYVKDAGLFEKGGTNDWNPEKAWLNK